jgi:hypothetical protein
MTDMPIGTERQKLGVGDILGDTFTILFGNMFKVMLLSLLPIIALIALAVLLIVPFVLGGQPDNVLLVIAIVAVGLMYFAALFIMTALIVRFAYDVKTGHPLRLGSYFSSTLSVLAPLLICSLVTGIAILFGFALLFVPGLYLMAMWICVTPAIVIEGAGLGSLSRSIELTRDYRWACVGAILLMFLCLFGLGIVVNIMEAIAKAIAGELVGGLVSIVLNGLLMAFSGIFGALVYARLREIKEGTSVEQLADVFA